TDLADLNPQRRPARRVNCAQPASVLETIVDTTLFTLGRNCVDVEFGDASGNVGHATAVFDVAPPIGGHVNVANVPVVATDLNNVPAPVTTTFVVLQQPGLVTAVTTPPPGAAPAGRTIVGPTFDIRTTALAPPAVVVCLQFAVEQGDRLFWWDGAAWVD